MVGLLESSRTASAFVSSSRHPGALSVGGDGDVLRLEVLGDAGLRTEDAHATTDQLLRKAVCGGEDPAAAHSDIATTVPCPGSAQQIPAASGRSGPPSHRMRGSAVWPQLDRVEPQLAHGRDPGERSAGRPRRRRLKRRDLAQQTARGVPVERRANSLAAISPSPRRAEALGLDAAGSARAAQPVPRPLPPPSASGRRSWHGAGREASGRGHERCLRGPRIRRTRNP